MEKKKFVKFKTIRGRLLCYMALLGILPLLLLGIISYHVSRTLTMQQVVKIHEYNIESYDKNLTVLFENIRHSARDFIYDSASDIRADSIVMLLGKDPSYFSELSAYRQHEILEELDKKTLSVIPESLMVNRLVLDNQNGFRYTKSYVVSTEPALYLGTDRPLEKGVYEAAQAANGKECFLGRSEEAGLFDCVKMIYNLRNFAPVGYLTMTIDSGLLGTVLPTGEELEGSSYAVVDSTAGGEPRVVFSAGTVENLKGVIRDYYRGGLDMRDGWQVGKMTNSVSGWDILYVLDKDVLAVSSNVIGMATLGICLVLVVIVGLIGVLLTHIINRPLDKLGNAIRQVDEQGDYKITEEFGEDEIGQIGRRFKRMVEQNLALKDSLYETGMRQKEAQLQALQAQINPHFLYNTLDSIYLMTQMGRPKEAGDMTLALSEIFKLSLNHGREFTKVKEEVSHVTNYLYIQKMRYGEKLNFLIDVADDMMEERMLKLILQPIVENAIYHGLEPKLGQGTVRISGRMADGELIFEIEDNGVGMEKDDWKKGYGLTNVRQRIQLYYGGTYDLEVESRPGEGTRITVRLPAGVQTAGMRWED